eukprot:COSAG04_NODE_3503_length_2764_cov_15.932458_1_plen_165_part_00
MPAGACAALARIESRDQHAALMSLLTGLCPRAPELAEECEVCYSSPEGGALRVRRAAADWDRPESEGWRLRHAVPMKHVQPAAATTDSAGGSSRAAALPLSVVETEVTGPVATFLEGLGYSSDAKQEFVRRRLSFVKPPSGSALSGDRPSLSPPHVQPTSPTSA